MPRLRALGLELGAHIDLVDLGERFLISRPHVAGLPRAKFTAEPSTLSELDSKPKTLSPKPKTLEPKP